MAGISVGETRDILKGAYDPIPAPIRLAAEARVRKFVTEEASLAELFAMLELAEVQS